MHLRPADFRGSKRFEVLSKLGSGATGVVYAARDRETGEKVALKVLTSLNPESIADFKREFRAMADLDHPNLVRLGELILEADRWLFTMELVDGVDFYSHVRPDGLPDTERLRAALVQLMAALDALHATGQVHRDVKPSNVLVRDDGSVKLLDFGLVTQMEHDDVSPSDADAVGTTAYVAPEQAAGRAVGPSADFYSVGAMLYEALTGRLPFEGPPLKILMDKQTMRAAPPSALAPGVDVELERLCLELLQADPSMRPSAARIVGKLRGKRAQITNSQPTRSHVFFGREREIDALLGSISSRSDRPQVRVVMGASGIGKTALLNRVARRLATSGALVLSNRCRAQESVPYRALDGVFEDLAHYLTRLSNDQVAAVLPRHAGLLGRTFPALSRVEAIARAPLEDEQVRNPLGQRKRAFSAIRELMVSLSRRQSVVITLDDIHWADDDSLQLLRLLLRAVDAPPLSLFVTYNKALGRDAGGAGLAMSDLRTLLPISHEPFTLEGLDQRSATQLVRHLLALDPPPNHPDPDLIAREADGHPRLIEELVQHLKDHTLSGPISIDEVVRSRTEALEPSSLQIITLLAIADAPVSPEVIRQAAGLEPDALARELRELKLMRLIRAVGVRGKERVELYHDRIRDTALAQLPDEERMLHHRALALAHEVARSEDHEAVSRHFEGAGALDRAAEHAARAADEALVALAFARAAILYQRAVELSGDGVPSELHARHGDALVSAGRGPEGARAYLSAASHKKTAEAIDLRRRAAEQLMVCGHAEDGLEIARAVVRELSLAIADNPRWGRIRSVARLFRIELRGLAFRERDTSEIAAIDLARIDACWSLFVGLAAIDPQRLFDPLSLHVLLALQAGEPYRVGRGLAALSMIASMERGQAQRAQELAERAEAIAERVNQPHLTGLCQLNAGLRAYYAGDLDVAKASFGQAERTFQEGCRGASWELGTSQFFLLMCHLAAGDVATLTRLGSDWYEDARARGDLFASTNLRVRVLPAGALLNGHPARARSLADPRIPSAMGPATSIQMYWREASLIEHALYMGEGAKALARVRDTWPAIERSRLLDIRSVHVEAHWLKARATLAALAAGDPSARPADVLKDIAQIEAGDMGGYLGIALSLRAALAELVGDHGTAGPAWRGAEAQLRADGRALLAQLARLRRGALGQDAEAERVRREAEIWLNGAGISDARALLTVYMPGLRR